MARFKLWRPFREWSPVIKAVAWMLPATLTVLVHHLVMATPPDTKEILARWYQLEMQSWTNIADFVIWTPFKEEAIYRWPSLLLLAALFQQIIKREPVRRQAAIATAYIVSITVMIVMTAFWAKDHDYPITVFLYGVIWGLLMFKTNNPLYPWLFHAFSNAISLIFIAVGYHWLCK